MIRQIIGQAKKHPSLIPLFIFIGAGGTGAALYVLRLALFNPDVSWDKKNNPEPWNKLGPNDQYKCSGSQTSVYIGIFFSSIPRDSDSVDLLQRLRICISDKVLDDVDAVGPWTTL
ncbi:hypothetical protein J1605_002977 [Eschrichtius robustus]|uniref:Cytochrome c oxidase subunit NDUFA4 n=1 Tax=Eschrichtius robustus TaxID=9764 RepID=A0AB34HU79_ESCRO|nr:hypothetical protein J1605_002977 [Eschrichtius robustus]